MPVLRILQLEHGPSNAGLKSTLADAGYECDIVRVNSRSEFLAELASSEFDLVVTDHERKLTEEVLRAAEARYRDLFESNPQPMWVYDMQTLAFLAVNDAAIERYGYS